MPPNLRHNLIAVASFDKDLSEIVAELNRAAPGGRQPSPSVPSPQPVPQSTSSLDSLLVHAIRRGASDVLLIAGAPVTLRIGGVLSPAGGTPLTAEDTRHLLLPLMTPAQAQDLQQNRSADLCFSREGIGRFRSNIHYQRGTVAGSLRLLPEKIPTLESLHLPPGPASIGGSSARPRPDHRTHGLRQKLHACGAGGPHQHPPPRSRRHHRRSRRVRPLQSQFDH